MLDQETGIDFPLFQSDVPDIFGEDPRDPDYQGNYLKVMNFSEFKPHFDHVRDFEGNHWNYKIYGNWVMEAPLRRAFGLLVARGLAKELRTYDGCHCIRPPKGGGMTWSMHAYALAIDFNAGSNGFGMTPTFSGGFVKCFAESGFEWGGLWQPNWQRDGMHFQLPWIKIREGNLAPVVWKV